MASGVSSDLEKSSFVDAEESDSFTMIERNNDEFRLSPIKIVPGEESESDVENEILDDNDEATNNGESPPDVKTNEEHEGLHDESIQVLHRENNDIDVEELSSGDSNLLLDMSVEGIQTIHEMLVSQEHLEKESLAPKAQRSKLQSIIASASNLAKSCKGESAAIRSSFVESQEAPSTPKLQRIMEVSSTSSVESHGSSPNRGLDDDNFTSSLSSSSAPESLAESLSSGGAPTAKVEEGKSYYRLLNQFSRLLLLACILGFFTAFLLLTWHSKQTHEQDMERLKLEEEKNLRQQTYLEKNQERYENFREYLIHQRYEETRQCRSTLETCFMGKEEFRRTISKMEQKAAAEVFELKGKLQLQTKEVHDLNTKIIDLTTENAKLAEENMRLKKELEKSVSVAYAQLLNMFLEILKNKGVQTILGGGIFAFLVSFTGNRMFARNC